MTANDRDKQALIRSQAGMRLIALLKILNDIDVTAVPPHTARLRQYIADSFHADLLRALDADARAAALLANRAAEGRTRILQVLGYDPHHVVVLSETERGAYYFLDDLTVEPDYPHRITGFDRVALVEDDDGADDGADGTDHPPEA